MNQLFSTLFSSFRAKATGLWNKLRLWASPAFWRTKGITKLREAFTRLFDVKPKSKKDYYTLFFWLVSKRLAYAVVISLCVVCLSLLYLLSPQPLITAGGAVRSYRYNSIALKFYKGTARVLAADGYPAYIGEVADGCARGQGALYRADGGLVYEGAFDNSRFNGEGSAYYPGSSVCYRGGFRDNLYSGTGKLYRPNGVLEYDGEYVAGVRSGSGALYNSGGQKIYTGTFQDDGIVYEELLGKTASQAAGHYTGASQLYSAAEGTCVAMNEINAVCALAGGASSLTQEWSVTGVYVPSGVFMANGLPCETIDSLTASLGPAEYSGFTMLTLPEAVAVNLMRGGAAERFGRVDITASADFDEVLTVSGYDSRYEVYIYTFQAGDLLYTFYAEKNGTNRFGFYSVSAAGS